MPFIISIDPGAVHCGVALWRRLPSSVLWQCDWAVEMTPEGCIDYVADALASLDGKPESVIIEGFWLKPGKAALQQTGSTMETVEVIGAVKHLCRWQGVGFIKVANGQRAIIQRLNAVGYEWVSRGHGGHAKDAEAVGVRGLDLSVSQIASVQQKRHSESV